MIVAFWHHSPPIRDNLVGLLWLAIPVFRLRLFVHKRLWSYTVLIDLFLLFILLSVFNFHNAPYSRANYPVLICRPLLGMWLYVYMSEHSREMGMRLLMATAIALSLIVGILAITATQWDGKSADWAFLIDALPAVSYRDTLPDMMLSFNPNEIAGAIAWLCPIMAGFMLYNSAEQKSAWADRLLNIGAGIAFVILFMALLPGQSRFAILGVLLALAAIILLLIKKPALKYGLLGALSLVALLQLALLLNLLPINTAPTATNDDTTTTVTPGLSGRDESTLSQRFDIWERGLRMTRDYPATGTGMSMFRSAVWQPAYQIPSYVARNTTPPHAHNEVIQIAADMGIPGVLLFLGWHLAAGWMLWQGWRNGTDNHRVLVISIAAGLLAHMIYGIGDAITLWDRYSFLFWFVLGLAGAQYIVLKLTHTGNTKSSRIRVPLN